MPRGFLALGRAIENVFINLIIISSRVDVFAAGLGKSTFRLTAPHSQKLVLKFEGDSFTTQKKKKSDSDRACAACRYLLERDTAVVRVAYDAGSIFIRRLSRAVLWSDK